MLRPNGRADQGGAILRGIGTAVPPHAARTEDTVEFLTRALEAQPDCTPRLVRMVASMAQRSGVEQRATVLPDFLEKEPARFEFFPASWSLDPFPTTAQRMARYTEAAPVLAEEAARRALADGDVDPASVTHLVLSTCTGFFAPGPDIQLIRRLGLRPDVQRTVVGFMGCYAGINALRLADQIVRADPKAVVLQVAVELCSLHYQRTPDASLQVANLLFGDGASSAVYSSEGPGRARVRATRSEVTADSADQMRWDIGDHGFVMHLDPSVPKTIEQHARAFVEALVDDAPGALGWAVHPGGRRIVEAVANALDLTKDDLFASFDVLREHGNLSSATILFVLDRALARRSAGDRVCVLGFGPGLTMEGATIDVLR
ncbi:MAG: type III polyketide synthase [Deltaproteobacteria bacterium]|jgi:alpha-pyrone synthase